MFFIGIFASPLPYMFLVAVYLSGYAYFFLDGHTGISKDDDNKQVDGCIVPAIPQSFDNTESCFFYDDNFSLADAAPNLNLRLLVTALPVRFHLPEVYGLCWHLPGQYSIRPPPGA
jgi:hypothetical protein